MSGKTVKSDYHNALLLVLFVFELVILSSIEANSSPAAVLP